MPLYEYRCEKCGARAEVFARSMTAAITSPRCEACKGHPAMVRALSKFARHLNDGDKLAEAEAKFGKQVDDVMGPMPDIGRYARRYAERAKDLPTKEDL